MSFFPQTTPAEKSRSQTLISVQLKWGKRSFHFVMLQIDCSDNPEVDLNPVALISNNTQTRKQTKLGTFHSFNCFSLGPLTFTWFSFYLFLKQWMRSLWLELQRKLLQTSSPRRCCWSASKGGRVAWKTEHTTKSGQRKQKNISTATVFVLYSLLLACERMRHLHALQLDVTHAHTHLQGTRQSQTRSKQRPSVLCHSSVGEQMEEIS